MLAERTAAAIRPRNGLSGPDQERKAKESLLHRHWNEALMHLIHPGHDSHPISIGGISKAQIRSRE